MKTSFGERSSDRPTYSALENRQEESSTSPTTLDDGLLNEVIEVMLSEAASNGPCRWDAGQGSNQAPSPAEPLSSVGDSIQRAGPFSSLLSNRLPGRAASTHGPKGLPSRSHSFSTVSSKDSIDTPKDSKLLVDKAFSIAFDSLSSMELREIEIFKILRSLKYENITSSQHNFDSLERGNKILLPFRNPHALAAALTNYVRGHILNDGGRFSISEKKALIAVKQITNLVKGESMLARKFILRRSLTRPMQWGREDVAEFIRILQLPEEKFDFLDGKEFLRLDGKSLADKFQIPSILQYRFLIYQNMLSLIEAWWDQGKRPGDSCVEGLVSSNSQKDLIEGMLVEVSDSSTLLASWIPYNRGFGWDAPLQSLTLLSDCIGGARGIIANPDVSQSTPTYTGCRLVSFSETYSEEVNQNIISRMQSFSGPPAIGLMVYIPKSCIRPVVESTLHGIRREDACVGKKIRLTTREVLLRSMDQFEWWDRPPVKVYLLYILINLNTSYFSCPGHGGSRRLCWRDRFCS